MVNREIRFRGKRVDDGEWIYGVPIKLWWHGSCTLVILEGGNIYGYELGDVRDNDVIPESVGQFTGLQDKNGKDIYEGDILKFMAKSFFEEELSEKTAIIEYNDNEMSWLIVDIELKNSIKPSFEIDNNNFEIIGNIIDNPELLK